MAKKNMSGGGGSDSTKVQKKPSKSVKQRSSTIGAMDMMTRGIGSVKYPMSGPMQQAVKQKKAQRVAPPQKAKDKTIGNIKK
jgi:hypothetical protein